MKKLQFEIRRAKFGDREVIFNLSNQFADNPLIKEDLLIKECLDEWLVIPEGRPSIALHDKKIIGFAYREVVDNQYLWDTAFRVHPDYQGRGIGKKFMEETFSIAKKEGLSLYNKFDYLNIHIQQLISRFRWQELGFWLILPIEIKSVPIKIFGWKKNLENYNVNLIVRRLFQIPPFSPFSFPGYIKNLTFYPLKSATNIEDALKKGKIFFSKNDFCFSTVKNNSYIDVSLLEGNCREAVNLIIQNHPEKILNLHIPQNNSSTINFWYPLSRHPKRYIIMKGIL